MEKGSPVGSFLFHRCPYPFLLLSLIHIYPVAAYITPEKFEWYRLKALEMGFSYCASAPLVRSSYMAEEALKSVKSL